MAIPIKTPDEIQKMREGGRILAQVLQKVCELARPGISTYELDQFAEDFIRKHGGSPTFKGYRGFPATLCTTTNEEIVHGIPSPYKILQEGDLFTVDCGVQYKGLHTDAARSISIGQSNHEKTRLIETAYKTLKEVTKIIKPGLPLNEIGKLVEKLVKKAGYKVIKDLTGHGVGRKLHEEPLITNFWNGNPGPTLKPGMTLAIEPIFAIGTEKMKTASDGWTLITTDHSPSVQVENTILVTEFGHEVLTELR